ncbi:hypothetical protein [Vibrio metoecus]|uniref:hypothetical protein n=1 Tax=Vibrio metoecus TaxID=1481663 RepID=UPI00164DB3DD|nr:hypothetical protein [Vibrio metoecus]
MAHLLCQVTHVDVGMSDHPTGVGMSKLILITVTDASFLTQWRPHSAGRMFAVMY